MTRLVARKAWSLCAVLLAVSFLTFMLINLLPGDPALQVLGPQGQVTPEDIAKVRDELNLDEPLPVRYAMWLGDALTGDLGRSYQTNQPVVSAIAERLPVTVQVAVMALLIAVVIAVPLGVLTAYKANSRFDRGMTAVTFGFLSIPNFMLALLLIYVFAVSYGVLPATGWTRLSVDVSDNLRSAVLPAVSLAVANIAVFTRLLRTDMIATLQENHVLMARAKGLPTWRILFRHALRPSSFSLLTVAGIQVGALLGGTVIIETIFGLPGVGRLLVDSIFQRDLLMVQGVVLVLAVSFVVINFLVDVAYSFLDPRIRLGSSRAHS